MKKIDRSLFDVLVYIHENGITSLEEIASSLKKDITDVETMWKYIKEKGYVDGFSLTKAGYDVIEPYRVKRAIFVAAGFGKRLVPVTINTPKPLVRVNGVRIIDGLIDAVIAAGIEDIYIVRGYLAEQFDQLLYKYPMIKFIENPLYTEANNISSAFCARSLLSNAYICEADLLIHKPQLIKKYQYCSNFLGFFKEHSDDWCFTINDGYISSQKIGGDNCYQEYGISYWDEEAGKNMENDILEVFEMRDGKDYYWDQVPLLLRADKYKVEVRECNEGDIVEIDTFAELKAIDKSYDI